MLGPGRCSSRPVTWHTDSDHPLRSKHEESKQCTQISKIMSVGKFILILEPRLASSGPSEEAASTIIHMWCCSWPTLSGELHQKRHNLRHNKANKHRTMHLGIPASLSATLRSLSSLLFQWRSVLRLGIQVHDFRETDKNSIVASM